MCKASYPFPQKYGGDVGPGKGAGTARKMRDELQELDKENEELKAEVRDLKQELSSERRTAEKVFGVVS